MNKKVCSCDLDDIEIVNADIAEPDVIELSDYDSEPEVKPVDRKAVKTEKAGPVARRPAADRIRANSTWQAHHVLDSSPMEFQA